MYASVTKMILTVGLVTGRALALTGDMTYYNTALGSCGWTNNDGEPVTALSPSKQSGNCGKLINIHYNGKTVNAVKVVDTCPGCAADAIDVTPSVFEKLAPLGAGRVQVTWDFA